MEKTNSDLAASLKLLAAYCKRHRFLLAELDMLELAAQRFESLSQVTEEEVKAVGKAINHALYNSLYLGKQNIPCLSKEQELLAGRAALEAARKART